MWPPVCQSCVSTTLENTLERRLITGTTCSPSFTARLPPGRKQFCTSITRSAAASSGLTEAAHSAPGIIAANAVVPKPDRICLRSNMVHLLFSEDLHQQIRSRLRRKAAFQCGRAPEYSSTPRLNSVPHGAEARKGLGPLVARRTADDAQGTLGAEPQPLHDGHRRIFLAADRIDPRFIAGLAVDADRFGHRDLAVAHAWNGRGDLLGKAAAI